MRFGTFFFFQATPGHAHADIIRRELEQVEWTEELGFDEVWFTERVIPKPIQRPHPPLYQVCVTKDGIENTGCEGGPC